MHRLWDIKRPCVYSIANLVSVPVSHPLSSSNSHYLIHPLALPLSLSPPPVPCSLFPSPSLSMLLYFSISFPLSPSLFHLSPNLSLPSPSLSVSLPLSLSLPSLFPSLLPSLSLTPHSITCDTHCVTTGWKRRCRDPLMLWQPPPRFSMSTFFTARYVAQYAPHTLLV